MAAETKKERPCSEATPGLISSKHAPSGGNVPGGGWSEEERVFALALALVPELSDWKKARLVAGCGSPRKVLARFPDLAGREVLARAENEWRQSQQEGFALLTWADAAYPELLKTIDDPPLALFAWGSLTPADGIALAMVGSRRATPYGIGACERLSSELARRGVTLVSGLARGIDAVAHRAALDSAGRTLAVLGSGLNRVYPREHLRLAERIACAGAVVSELPLASPPLPGHFPKRNRILSGLALGTVVIEAAEGSGSLITARHALEQNREVFAVPGPIGAPTSVGVHRLIQEGAKLVTSAEDVIEELRPDIRARLLPPPGEKEARAGETLTEDEQKVLAALPPLGAVDPDRLIEALGLASQRVASALVGLQLKGKARSFAGGSYGRRGS